MFCPECKAEYVPGIVECADCHVPLVYDLPQETDMDSAGQLIEWVPLLQTSYQADIAVIKSLFHGEKINYFIQGEHRGFSRGGILGSIVYVDKENLEDAQNLVRELELNPFSYSTKKENNL